MIGAGRTADNTFPLSSPSDYSTAALNVAVSRAARSTVYLIALVLLVLPVRPSRSGSGLCSPAVYSFLNGLSVLLVLVLAELTGYMLAPLSAVVVLAPASSQVTYHQLIKCVLSRGVKISSGLPSFAEFFN